MNFCVRDVDSRGLGDLVDALDGDECQTLVLPCREAASSPSLIIQANPIGENPRCQDVVRSRLNGSCKASFLYDAMAFSQTDSQTSIIAYQVCNKRMLPVNRVSGSLSTAADGKRK